MIKSCGICTGESGYTDILEAIYHLKTNHPRVFDRVAKYIKDYPRKTKEANGQP